MGLFDHQADLSTLTIPELIARLRGDYGTARYKPEPLQLEAARRLEDLNALVEIGAVADRVTAQIGDILRQAVFTGPLTSAIVEIAPTGVRANDT